MIFDFWCVLLGFASHEATMKRGRDSSRKGKAGEGKGTASSRKGKGTASSGKSKGTASSRKSKGTASSRKGEGTASSRKGKGTASSSNCKGTDVSSRKGKAGEGKGTAGSGKGKAGDSEGTASSGKGKAGKGKDSSGKGKAVPEWLRIRSPQIFTAPGAPRAEPIDEEQEEPGRTRWNVNFHDAVELHLRLKNIRSRLIGGLIVVDKAVNLLDELEGEFSPRNFME